MSGTFTDDKTFSYSRTFTCGEDEGLHDNTASFTTNDTPLSGSDDASVTVNCYDLSVIKTAEEFFTRTYHWTINKEVDNPGPITVQRDQSVDVNYTVVVDLADPSYTDSDWQVTGSITITNTHPSRAAELTQVLDDAGGIAGIVDCGGEDSVPAGGSLTCSYDTGKQNPESGNPFGTLNTATATQQLYNFGSDGTPTVDGSMDYSGTAPIDFSEATITEIDEMVDVTDTYTGVLGTCAAEDAPCTFEYPRTITAPDAFCGDLQVDNTATFTTNDTGATGSDDASVVISVPCEGCTPGFWQGGAGSIQWDEVDDPDWTGDGTNPFIHTTLFNDFFYTETDNYLDGWTMMDLVGTGGDSVWAQKAARDMVAAYLNESAFPGTFPAEDISTLVAMWYAAVAESDSGYQAFHDLVAGWNDPKSIGGYCPLP